MGKFVNDIFNVETSTTCLYNIETSSRIDSVRSWESRWPNQRTNRENSNKGIAAVVNRKMKSERAKKGISIGARNGIRAANLIRGRFRRSKEGKPPTFV